MKTNKHIIFATVLLALSVLLSCNKEEPTAYQNDPRLNFWHDDLGSITSDIAQGDSINHTFLYIHSSVKYDTVKVAVQAMGLPASNDRPIRVKQINSSETYAAVAGTHYVAFEDLADLYYMPAGKSITYVPVVLIQDESLDYHEYRLELEIVPNEFFEAGLPDYQNFVVTTSNIYTKPTVWETYRWNTYFGDWGPIKMRFLIDYVTGEIDWEARPVTDEVYYLNGLAREQLAKYEAENGPLYEDPNDPESRVTFPVLAS